MYTNGSSKLQDYCSIAPENFTMSTTHFNANNDKWSGVIVKLLFVMHQAVTVRSGRRTAFGPNRGYGY